VNIPFDFIADHWWVWLICFVVCIILTIILFVKSRVTNLSGTVDIKFSVFMFIGLLNLASVALLFIAVVVQIIRYAKTL